MKSLLKENDDSPCFTTLKLRHKVMKSKKVAVNFECPNQDNKKMSFGIVVVGIMSCVPSTASTDFCKLSGHLNTLITQASQPQKQHSEKERLQLLRICEESGLSGKTRNFDQTICGRNRPITCVFGAHDTAIFPLLGIIQCSP